MINEIQNKTNELTKAVENLAQTGIARAKAERDYKTILSKKSLQLRDTQMAVGMIDKVIYGLDEVANARFNRDVAEVMYRVALEQINALKLQIRILDNQISREWSLDE